MIFSRLTYRALTFPAICSLVMIYAAVTATLGHAENNFPDNGENQSSSGNQSFPFFNLGSDTSKKQDETHRHARQPSQTQPVHVADSKKKPATAAKGDDDSKLTPEQIRELYLHRKRIIEQANGRQQELTSDSKNLAIERARMQARLVETAQALKSSEKRLSEVEETLSKARDKVKAQRAVLDEKTAKMSALFAMMQAMGRQPPPMIITHSRDALNMIRTGMVVSTFYADVEKLATSISTELAQLEDAQKSAERLEAQYRAEQTQNAELQKQINALLVENQDQIDITQTNLANLKNVVKINAANLKTLEEMVPKLNEEVAKQSGLGSYETELAQGKDIDLAPDKANLAMQAVRMKPAIPFAKSQGLLPYPAQGKIVVSFGQNNVDGVPSKGTHIETRGGAQIVSPCDGWIIFTGPFKSYGQLLIINPGGGYLVIIAGIGQVQASVGQFVLAGEPIAVMGSLQQQEGGGLPIRPTLYVEFQKGKQSIDPAPWWSAGVGKG